MLNVTEIATATEERVLTGVKASQALVIDGLKNARSIADKVADKVVPANVSDRIEDRTAALPSAAPAVEGAFAFAGKLLEAQREFASEVIGIFQPAAKPAASKAKKATKAA